MIGDRYGSTHAFDCVIYMLHSVSHNFTYIGQSIRGTICRMREHFSFAIRICGKTHIVAYDVMRPIGFGSFVMRVLCYVKPISSYAMLHIERRLFHPKCNVLFVYSHGMRGKNNFSEQLVQSKMIAKRKRFERKPMLPPFFQNKFVVPFDFVLENDPKNNLQNLTIRLLQKRSF